MKRPKPDRRPRWSDPDLLVIRGNGEFTAAEAQHASRVRMERYGNLPWHVDPTYDLAARRRMMAKAPDKIAQTRALPPPRLARIASEREDDRRAVRKRKTDQKPFVAVLHPSQEADLLRERAKLDRAKKRKRKP